MESGNVSPRTLVPNYLPGFDETPLPNLPAVPRDGGTADKAVASALEHHGRYHEHSASVHLVEPTWSRVELFKSGVRKLATVGMPAVMSAVAGFYMYSAGIESDLAIGISTSLMLGLSGLNTGATARQGLKEFVRIGSTQFASQIAGFALKFGLEQAAIAADPTLSNPQGMSSNFTEGNSTQEGYFGDQAPFPDTAWYSLAVVGLPMTLQLLTFLVPARGGTTAIDALIDRAQYDAREPDRPTRRFGECAGTTVRFTAKALIAAIPLGVTASLAVMGQRKLLMRMLSVANSTMMAARVRDYINHLVRGTPAGSPVTERWADDGWRREQQVTIPRQVLAALDAACTTDGILDDQLKAGAIKVLKEKYRDLFIDARGASFVLYWGASEVGLAAIREYFAPSVKGVYAEGFTESLRTFAPSLLGTTFVEGSEEVSWLACMSLLASWRGLPFEISKVPADPLGKVSENFRKLSVTAMLAPLGPIQIAARSCYAPFYEKSQVSVKTGADGVSTPEVTISLNDSLELHSGIRIGQNITTAWIFTAAGNAADPATKSALFTLAAFVNGLTHFRGNVVAQILQSGREAKLLYDHSNVGDEEAIRRAIKYDIENADDEGETGHEKGSSTEQPYVLF